jgi:hypothetical protein
MKNISESDFPTSRREPILDFAYYIEEAEDLYDVIPIAVERLNDAEWIKQQSPAALARLTRGRLKDTVDLITLSYSAGVDIQELHDFFPAVVGYFEEFFLYELASNHANAENQGDTPAIYIQMNEFTYANRILCFAVLLGCPQYISRIMEIVNYNNPVLDGMLERIAGVYGQRTSPLPEECTRHLPYFKTLAIFDAAPEKRPVLMRDYLLDWYHASRRESYHDAHARGVPFQGYWSWEAGAITVALDIDDATYRDLAFYPRDMVDYARAQGKPGASDKGTEAMSRLRIKAGEPCPIEGTWESIGIPTRKVDYQNGAPMLDLGSPYGLTVWQYIGSGVSTS